MQNKIQLNSYLFIVISVFFNISLSHAQDLKIVSWNIKDFGKSRDSKEILDIARLIKEADIVAIQEVVAKDPGGAQAVARLVDQLDRMGANWDYIISDMTKSPSSNIRERYAFIWKKHKVKLQGRGRLISELSNVVNREPFIAKFKYKNSIIHIINYHACTHKSNFPERKEIMAISNWLNKNKFDNTLFVGDMNLKHDDLAFRKLYSLNYTNALNGERTSLKRKCIKGNYLSRAEDNIYLKLNSLKYKRYKILDFIKLGDCLDVKWKRNSYSDHLPIQIVLKL